MYGCGVGSGYGGGYGTGMGMGMGGMSSYGSMGGMGSMGMGSSYGMGGMGGMGSMGGLGMGSSYGMGSMGGMGSMSGMGMGGMGMNSPYGMQGQANGLGGPTGFGATQQQGVMGQGAIDPATGQPMQSRAVMPRRSLTANGIPRVAPAASEQQQPPAATPLITAGPTQAGAPAMPGQMSTPQGGVVTFPSATGQEGPGQQQGPGAAVRPPRGSMQMPPGAQPPLAQQAVDASNAGRPMPQTPLQRPPQAPTQSTQATAQGDVPAPAAQPGTPGSLFSSSTSANPTGFGAVGQTQQGVQNSSMGLNSSAPMSPMGGVMGGLNGQNGAMVQGGQQMMGPNGMPMDPNQQQGVPGQQRAALVGAGVEMCTRLVQMLMGVASGGHQLFSISIGTFYGVSLLRNVFSGAPLPDAMAGMGGMPMMGPNGMPLSPQQQMMMKQAQAGAAKNDVSSFLKGADAAEKTAKASRGSGLGGTVKQVLIFTVFAAIFLIFERLIRTWMRNRQQRRVGDAGGGVGAGATAADDADETASLVETLSSTTCDSHTDDLSTDDESGDELDSSSSEKKEGFVASIARRVAEAKAERAAVGKYTTKAFVATADLPKAAFKTCLVFKAGEQFAISCDKETDEPRPEHCSADWVWARRTVVKEEHEKVEEGYVPRSQIRMLDARRRL